MINALVSPARLIALVETATNAAVQRSTYVETVWDDVTIGIAPVGRGVTLTVKVVGFGSELRNVGTQDINAIADVADVAIVNRLARGK